MARTVEPNPALQSAEQPELKTIALTTPSSALTERRAMPTSCANLTSLSTDTSRVVLFPVCHWLTEVQGGRQGSHFSLFELIFLSIFWTFADVEAYIGVVYPNFFNLFKDCFISQKLEVLCEYWHYFVWELINVYWMVNQKYGLIYTDHIY